MRCLVFALALWAAAPAAQAPFTLVPPDGGASDVAVTAFARDLSFPLGMAALPDGSLLVTESPAGSFFTPGTGRLTRLVDADGDGVAESRAVVVSSVPGGSLTAVRLFGGVAAVVSVNGPITFYRVPATPAGAYALAGEARLSYPSGSLHRTSALAVRLAPGVEGAWDLLFQVGSRTNATRTSDPVPFTGPGGYATALDPDAVYLVRVRVPPSGNVEVVSHAIVARGLRNAASLAFHPTTGDLYLVDNGIDGTPDANEPLSADVLHRIAAADVGIVVPDFGFPDRYVAYRTGTLVGGGPAPLVAFQPIPDPPTGAEAEGANDMAFVPASFPANVRGRLAVGFHGRFSAGGVANEENPLALVDVAGGSYVHWIRVTEPAVGHLDGVLATDDALFLADLSPSGTVGTAALGQGVVYRLAPRSPVAGAPAPDASAPDASALALVVAPRAPTSRSLRVTVRLAAPGPLVLRLVDATGRTARVLHDGPAPEAVGVTARLDGLASGIYWLVADAAGQRASRSVPVVR